MNIKNTLTNLIKKVGFKAKNALDKNAINIVLSCNFKQNSAQISTAFGTDLSLIKTSDYSFNHSFLSANFLSEFIQVLHQLVAEYPLNTAKNCYVILPDDSVVLDSITLPQISGRGQNRALLAAIEKNYINNNELCFKSALIIKNKNDVTYSIAAVNNKIISTILSALKQVNFNCKLITFSANCIANYVVNANPDYKKKNLLFVNVNKNFTDFIAVFNGKIASCAQKDIGYLSNNNLIDSSSEFNKIFKWANVFAQNLSLTKPYTKIDEIVYIVPQNFVRLIKPKNENIQFSIFNNSQAFSKNNMAILGALNLKNKFTDFNFYEKV